MEILLKLVRTLFFFFFFKDEDPQGWKEQEKTAITSWKLKSTREMIVSNEQTQES